MLTSVYGQAIPKDGISPCYYYILVYVQQLKSKPYFLKMLQKPMEEIKFSDKHCVGCLVFYGFFSHLQCVPNFMTDIFLSLFYIQI